MIFRWRTHAYEITHEIKNRKEDAFKREQKLIQELNTKSNAMKDQTRIILQHENSIHHFRSENETLKSANSSLNQRVSWMRLKLGLKFLFIQTKIKIISWTNVENVSSDNRAQERTRWAEVKGKRSLRSAGENGRRT